MNRGFGARTRREQLRHSGRQISVLQPQPRVDDDDAGRQAPVRTVYDAAARTGGTLTVAEQPARTQRRGRVEVLGQELNPETWAIARSELMRNANPERMAPGNSLTSDAFRGTRFDDLLANPPYG